MKRFIVFFLLLFVPLLALAGDFSAEENFFVTKEQVLDYNLIRTGNTIDLSGTINKDVYVFGNSVVVDGTIKGDLIGAAQSLTINGTVEGNVRFAAETIVINGDIGRMLTVAGAKVQVNKPVAWGIMAAGAEVLIKAEQPEDVNVFAANVGVIGNIGGNLYLTAEKISLAPNIEVAGNFEYVETEKSIDNIDSLLVSGQTVMSENQRNKDFDRVMAQMFLLTRVFYFLGLLLLAFVMLGFMKLFTITVSAVLQKEYLKCFNRGFWWLILVPVAAVLLLVTIIGLPLGIIGLTLWLIAMYVSKVFAALAIGAYILKEDVKKGKLYWPMLLGLLVVVILTSLPFVGFLLNLMISTAGLGALYLVLRGNKLIKTK